MREQERNKERTAPRLLCFFFSSMYPKCKFLSPLHGYIEKKRCLILEEETEMCRSLFSLYVYKNLYLVYIYMCVLCVIFRVPSPFLLFLFHERYHYRISLAHDGKKKNRHTHTHRGERERERESIQRILLCAFYYLPSSVLLLYLSSIMVRLAEIKKNMKK